MPAHLSIQTQHAIGALVGSAVGDALGAPFEFKPAGRYSARFPQPVLGGRGEMIGGGPWTAGEFTDDTHMALALAESLLAHGGLDATDLWSRWRAWAATAKDVGILTRHALARATHDGAAAHAHAANGGRSAGNGSLMRNTPVALFTLREPLDSAVALAVAQSRLTHHDAANDEGVAIHTAMVRAGVLGEGDDDIFAALDAAVGRLAPEPRERWRALLDPSWQPSDAQFGNGTVWTCLAQAVWAVRRAKDFEEAVRTAVDLGEDADTVGCVAGSLAGARWGIQAIPSRWTTYVHGAMQTPAGERRYDFVALQEVARGFALSCSSYWSIRNTSRRTACRANAPPVRQSETTAQSAGAFDAPVRSAAYTGSSSWTRVGPPSASLGVNGTGLWPSNPRATSCSATKS